MQSVVTGIDPGLTGALSLFVGGKLIDVVDMPVDVHLKERKGATIRDLIGGKKQIVQRHVAIPALKRLLESWATYGPMHVVRERVGPRPNQASHRLMEMSGILDGVIGALGFPLHYVEPATWKREMAIPADKDRARLAAIELFPDWEKVLSRKMDHNRAEAMLIGYYGVGLVASEEALTP